MDLKLVKYRGEESEYVYFWTERQGEVDVHMSPMFNDMNAAIAWMDSICNEVRKICDKLKEE